MHPNTIKEVIKSDLCLGCGLCHVINEDTDITEKDGNLKSSFKNTASKEDHIKVCPCAGYDIEEMGKSIHQAPHFIYELGYYSSLQLVHSTDDEILKRASSGGAMTAIALYMLESGKADGIICTKYTYLTESQDKRLMSQERKPNFLKHKVRNIAQQAPCLF